MRVVCLLFVLSACASEISEKAPPDGPPACTVDCSPDRPDAPRPTQPDAAEPPGEDVVVTDLTFAALPDEVKDEAKIEIVEGESGTPYESVTSDVSPSTIGPSVENRSGREVALVIRWGHIPPESPGRIDDWTDSSGYLAVSAGAIEVVRVLRWEGTQGPDRPRPRQDFVATQTDPRVVRFRSSVGSGSDGLLVRVVRPVIEPVVLVIKLGKFEHELALDQYMGNQSQIGGLEVPAGDLLIDSSLPLMSAACYVPDGTAELSVSYSGSGAIDAVFGSATLGGAGQEVMLHGDELQNAYGNAAGSLGSSPASIFYARRFVLGEFDTRGVILGRIDGSVPGFLVGAYDGPTANVSFFHRAPCTDPGAQHRNFFDL